MPEVTASVTRLAVMRLRAWRPTSDGDGESGDGESGEAMARKEGGKQGTGQSNGEVAFYDCASARVCAPAVRAAALSRPFGIDIRYMCAYPTVNRLAVLARGTVERRLDPAL